jgi:RNA methyltransferase, TrmH family
MAKKIESLQHPLIKHLVKLRQDRAYRYTCKRVFVEGKNLINELPHAIAIVGIEDNFPPHLKSCERVVVTPAVMQKISAVKTPEGLIAEVEMPPNQSMLEKEFILAIDGVSDPGNLGTLLRTALALGWEGAFILEGSCDPYNEKALRAAKGATFRLPLCQGSWDELMKIPKPRYVADLQGESIKDYRPKKGAILVLGKESLGVSPLAKKECTPLTIPMSGAMESLNVAAAGAILMYAMKGSHV